MTFHFLIVSVIPDKILLNVEKVTISPSGLSRDQEIVGYV